MPLLKKIVMCEGISPSNFTRSQPLAHFRIIERSVNSIKQYIDFQGTQREVSAELK